MGINLVALVEYKKEETVYLSIIYIKNRNILAVGT